MSSCNKKNNFVSIRLNKKLLGFFFCTGHALAASTSRWSHRAEQARHSTRPCRRTEGQSDPESAHAEDEGSCRGQARWRVKRWGEDYGAAARRSRAVRLTGEDKLLSVLKVTGGFVQAREEEERRPAW